MPRLGETHAPLHGKVIAELRHAILTQRFKPGDRLVEGRLASEFGVSRNPVREAIRVLASEGLIEVTARRGASVIMMTEQEARETVEVRAVLEGHNARLAARRQDTRTLKRIAQVLEKGTAAVAARRFDQLTELNQQFHRELAAAGQNLVLGEVLRKLRERTAVLFAPNDPVRQGRSWEEHAAILRAIIDGDERAAAVAAAEHVMRAGADYLVSLDVAADDPLQAARPAGITKLRSGMLRVSSVADDDPAPGKATAAKDARIKSGHRLARRERNGAGRRPRPGPR
ncbi:MAG: GntR family transcriptional regulator [Xanthobacteraceae bacterium]|nr:GntR family transcriptional regulator [Xanthobacteraceae bacterium]